MQFPCFDALTYAHFCEGKIDAVMQCQNKIWDVHAVIPIIAAASSIIYVRPWVTKETDNDE